MVRFHNLAALTAAAAVLAAGGCSSSPAATKAGGSPRPVTLSLGTDDGLGTPGAQVVEQFARQVDEASDGRLVIEPVWHAAGQPSPPGWDQVVARRVVSGDIEMGLVPSRAWDTEGVSSLRALNAPFLITSNAVLEAVTRGDLAARLMSGLEGAGVTGLALYPEGLRHVFGVGRVLDSPSDFEGTTIRAARSETVSAVFRALGATTDDPDGTAFADGLRDGTLAGAETSLVLAGGFPGREPTTAGNLAFFPKVQTLVVNSDAYDRLGEERRAQLREAAAATQEWAAEHDPDDATAARDFRARGGTVVLASTADVEAMARATQPVYDELEGDGLTRELIADIERVGSSTPSDPLVEACNGASEPSSPATTSTGEAAQFPPGVYRTEVTVEDLVDAGADEPWANDVAGMWTMTFADGSLTMVDVNARSGLKNVAPGTYCVTGDRVSIDLFGDPGVCGDGEYFSAAWSLGGDELRFLDTKAASDEEADVRALYGATTWRKIG